MAKNVAVEAAVHFPRVRLAYSQGTLFPLFASIITGSLIIAPVLVVLFRSLTTARLGAFVGLTGENYMRVLADPKIFEMLWNSTIYAAGSAILGTVLGALLAWIVARTNTPGKALVELMPLYPILMPPIMKNIAWILLLAPNAGILNNLLLEYFGIEGRPFNAFSMSAMIWVFGLACVPLGYLFLLPVFLSFDPSLEESAYIAGSRPMNTLWRITFPLAIPAFLSALILNFLRGLRSFETPVLQGSPGGIHVFVSRVYDAMSVEYNPALATAYSAVLVVISILVLLFYIRTTRFSERYATITGKGYRVKVIDIGKWKYVTFLVVFSYFLIGIAIPFVVLIVVSFIPYYDFETFMKFPTNMVLANYYRVMRHPSFVTGLYNSLTLSLTIAVVTVLMGIVMAFTMYRTRAYGTKIFEFIGSLPLAFPPLVLSLGLVIVFLGTPLYNTLWALGLGLFVAYFPYALRNASGSIVNIHKELDEAAWVHGARWRHVFFKVTLPILKPSVAGALFYIFIESIRNIDVAVLLTAPGVEYGPVTLFEYFRVGQWAEAAAGGVIYLIILIVAVSVAKLAFNVKLSL
ncbi:MAG TPA: iron ABC transporter permease [Candidatus Binatia bacterium]|jgi:iron(III) transport system permease protein|nr:iron ABC transporter permease [Candidatus Binatia bacterium]